MKNFKTLLLIFFAAASVSLCAQTSPWSKFLKPATYRVENQILPAGSYKGFYKITTSSDSTSFLFTPDWTLTGSFYPLKSGGGKIEGFNSAGLGVSYRSYSLINGEAYCNYGINLDFMSRISLDGQNTAGFGGALSVSLKNNAIRLGVAYMGSKGFSNGYFGPIFGLSLPTF
jgi:hypothetical protein